MKGGKGGQGRKRSGTRMTTKVKRDGDYKPGALGRVNPHPTGADAHHKKEVKTTTKLGAVRRPDDD